MSFANVGSVDRGIRLLAGAGLIAFTLLGGNVDPSSNMGIGMLVVGGVLIATSVISFCPLYKILGLNSGSS